MTRSWRIDENGHFDCDELTSKPELIAALEAWLAGSKSPTLGDTRSFGGRPLLWFRVGGRRAHINADTKRSAVEAAVSANRTHSNQPWRVVPNRNGTINKILPWPEDRRLEGWYAYLAEPLDRGRTL